MARQQNHCVSNPQTVMRRRLLLVDDDALVVKCYRDSLSAHGFQVNTAADGAGAIAILRAARPDLIVLDLMMPNLSGVEVLKFIRSQPKLAATPVIVLTNVYMNDLGRQAAAVGIERALLKSQCSPSVLMSVIDEILQSKHASDVPSPLPDAAATAPGVSAAEVPPVVPPIQQASPPASPPAHADAAPAVPSAHPVAALPRPGGDVESKDKASGDLLAHARTVSTDLRKLFQAFTRESRTGQPSELRLQDFYRKVRFLAATAGLTEHPRAAQLATVFEALLHVLIQNPARIGPSVLRTIANLVDMVDRLFQQAGEGSPGVPLSAQVLVADDDPLANRLVVAALQQAQLQARSTEDPLVAWEWLQREHFDLVLLDIEMPGLTGFELCKRLRALPGYAKTPVIYVTNHTDFEHRAQSTLSGGDDLIAKPILPMELAAKVVMHLLKNQMPNSSKASG